MLIIAFLREHLKVAETAAGVPFEATGYALDVMARVVMLAADPEALAILNDIADPGPGRQVVDDPNQSTEAKWGRLTTEFVNNKAWEPENSKWGEDMRIRRIDPSQAPVVALTTAEVRAIWRILRNKYTQCDISFHASGGLDAGAPISAADRFWERHVVRLCPESEDVQLAVLFMYWVHDGAPPKLCTRSQVYGMATESGFDGGRSTGNISTLAPPTAKGHRVSEGITKDDLQAVLAQVMVADAETIAYRVARAR